MQQNQQSIELVFGGNSGGATPSAPASATSTAITTTSAFAAAVDAYEAAVNAKNALFRTLDKSRAAVLKEAAAAAAAVTKSEDDTTATAATAASRLLTAEQSAVLSAVNAARLQKRKASSSDVSLSFTAPLATDGSLILGHVPIGYGRNDVGGVYAHPRFPSSTPTSAATEKEEPRAVDSSPTMTVVVTDDACGFYAASRIQQGAINVKGRNVLQIIVPPTQQQTSSSEVDGDSTAASSTAAAASAAALPSIVAALDGGARNVVVAPAVVPSSSSSASTVAAAAAFSSSLKAQLEANVWSVQRSAFEKAEAEAEEAAKKEKAATADGGDADTRAEKEAEAPNHQKQKRLFCSNLHLYGGDDNSAAAAAADGCGSSSSSPSSSPLLVLGDQCSTRHMLTSLVHNVGFDVILVVLPFTSASAASSLSASSSSNFNTSLFSSALFTTIAALLSKDRSAAAYLVFNDYDYDGGGSSSSDDDGAPPSLLFSSSQLDGGCDVVGLDFVKVDEAVLSSSTNDGTIGSAASASAVVSCYKLFLRLDEAGLPLDPFYYYGDAAAFSNSSTKDNTSDGAPPANNAVTAFDVVIQGTGMSEAFLSAALARAGKKVLHLDAGGNYGGPAFASIDLAAFHRQYCLPLNSDGSYGDGYKHYYGSAMGESCYGSVAASLKVDRLFNSGVGGGGYASSSSSSSSAAGNNSNADGGKSSPPPPLLTERELRQTIIDAVPLYSFARGPLINTLVDGRAGRNLEFMTVDRVVLLEATNNTNKEKEKRDEKKDETTNTAPTAVEGLAAATTSSAATTAGGGASSSLAARRALLAAKKMAKSAVDTLSTTATATLAATAATASGVLSKTTGTNSNSNGSSDTFVPRLIPFSRADVFKGGNNLFANPLEARRAMKFFKDLEKSFDHTAEDSGNENELDKRVEMAKAKEGEEEVAGGGGENNESKTASTNATASNAAAPFRILCADGETYRKPLPWELPSQDQSEPLEAFLGRHYGLCTATIDLLTMGGALVPYASSAVVGGGKERMSSSSSGNGNGTVGGYSLSSAINLIRTSLASVGRFGVGDTPFLCPMYGAGEVPQNMCRIAAVWDATFILRRCVRSIVVEEEEEDAGNGGRGSDNSDGTSNGAAASNTTATKGNAGRRITLTLSNGQRVRTSAVVLPKELAREYTTAQAVDQSNHPQLSNNPQNNQKKNECEDDGKDGAEEGGLHRAVMVLSQPLLSWSQLERQCNDVPPSDDSAEAASQKELRQNNKFPVLLGVLKVESDTRTTQQQQCAAAAAAPSSPPLPFLAPITVHQFGASTGHCPYTVKGPLPSGADVDGDDMSDGGGDDGQHRLTIVHFSADRHSMSRRAFEAAVDGLVRRGGGGGSGGSAIAVAPSATASTAAAVTAVADDGEAEGGSGSGAAAAAATAPPPPPCALGIAARSILYYATFSLDASAVASHSCGGAVFRQFIGGGAPAAAAQCTRSGVFNTSSLLVPSTATASSDAATAVANSVGVSGGDASDSREMRTLRASALPSLLNDSSYVCEAVGLYNGVMQYLLRVQISSSSPSSSLEGGAASGKAGICEAQQQQQQQQPTSSASPPLLPAYLRGGRQWMPFLYRLPDPTGRGSDEEDSDGDGGGEGGYESHAAYARRLLEGA